MKSTALLLVIVYFFVGCDSSKFKETPLTQFSGKWEVHGHQFLDGSVVEILPNEKGKKWKGRIIQKNDNKWVQLFVDSNDVYISSIKRLSNFEFQLTEKRIAGELFSSYELPSKDIYNVVFETEDRIQFQGKKNMYLERVK